MQVIKFNDCLSRPDTPFAFYKHDHDLLHISPRALCPPCTQRAIWLPAVVYGAMLLLLLLLNDDDDDYRQS